MQHSPPFEGSLFFNIFSWMYDSNLSDRSAVFFSRCNHCYISYSIVLSWINPFNPSNCPLSTDCVVVSYHYNIVLLNITRCCIPLFSGHHGRKYIACPSDAKTNRLIFARILHACADSLFLGMVLVVHAT